MKESPKLAISQRRRDSQKIISNLRLLTFLCEIPHFKY
ncbi:transcriptional regulator [Leptospira kirschneri serovar Pomona]|uniref:Transcriptional regulator n=1 Tax=Leptospira kirschneri serovar Pomona TaxID=561005 RepID=A0A1T1DL28_9LEPT|nr:transcriptional regulator [Leptospira kirschneri serovar Pomona]OOV50480.1 transcriptional regulator [Leptospira kirschneri serovar Grippotyphosa]